LGIAVARGVPTPREPRKWVCAGRDEPDAASLASFGRRARRCGRRRRQELAAWTPGGRRRDPKRWHAACLFIITMQSAPKFRHIALGRRLLGACLAFAPLALAGAADLQDLPQLESLAKAEAALQFPPLTERQRFVAGPIEPQLQLEKCRQPVKPVLASPLHMKDRVTIELRCPDAKSWHIYVPVRIVGTSPVVIVAHAIVMGTVLKATDLKVENHDISELPLGFLDDPAIAVGLTASRPIAGGAYLTNQQLVAAKAVQRGQSVTLVADAGGISVRMAGRALSDGLINQRIKVENLSSGKIIEGIARSEQTVEIILQ
jgi:flagella basal body P-ring formation protein FlgA